MRISESQFLEILADAERNRHGNILDKMALDLRDMREAVKILNDRLEALQGLSDSQAEALNMMEQGTLKG